MTYPYCSGNAGYNTRSVRFFGKLAAVEKAANQD